MELIIELARTVAAQGPWAAACVGMFGLVVLVVLKWVDAERRCYSGQIELQEKRVAERESTVIALREGNETVSKFADALAANTNATLNHTKLTIELGKDMRSNDDHWKLRASGWEATSGEIRSTLGANHIAIKELIARMSRQ